MSHDDIKVGMRVTPQKKSVGRPLAESVEYKDMLKSGKKYLYVSRINFWDPNNGENRVVLTNDVRSIGKFGDFFKASDFVRYNEDKSVA